MAGPDVYDYQRTTSGSAVTIIGVDLSLTPDDVDPLHDYSIYADRLTLGAGTYAMPGRTVTLRARTIDAKGATISVDGAGPAGKPEGKHRKEDAAFRQPGPNGDNGEDVSVTGAGKDAGRIVVLAGEITGTLTLSAAGGKGRDGGDGGDAGRGGDGANGADDRIIQVGHSSRDVRIEQGSQGEDGRPGGRGGDAGKPGAGGAGGFVLVTTLVQPRAGVLTKRAPGGASGIPGKPGGGADGGNPGIGGRLAVRRERRGPHNVPISYWELSENRRPGGQRGRHGDSGSPAQPRAGGDGTAVASVTTGPEQFYTEDANVYAQLQLGMHAMQIAYLNADFERARAVLLWLLVQLPTKDARKQDGKPYDAQWPALRTRVLVYVSRLDRGLDYFGNPSNWTPIVAFDRYRTDVGALISAGTALEQVYTRYDAAVKSAQAADAAFASALEAAAAALKTYGDQHTKLFAARNATWDEFLDLGTKLAAQRKVVEAAAKAFKDAVERKAACDSFEQILNLVVSVVTFGSGAISALKAISSLAGGAVEKAAAAAADKDKQPSIVDVFKKIYETGKNAKDIYDKWQKIKPLNDSIDPDYGKLAMEQQEFDDQIKPYLEMPEAAQYKKIVHDFVAVAQVRNAKLALFAQLHEDAVQIEALIEQTQAQIAKLKAARAAGSDPTLSPYRSFVKGLYDDYRAMLLRHLYNESMAFRYWALKDRPFVSGDTTIGELAAAHGTLVADTLDAIERSQSPTQRFEPQPYVLTANDADRRAQFETFRQTGTLTFSLPLDDAHYEGWAQVLAASFSISIHGAVTSAQNNRLNVYLYHSGQGRFLRQDGKPVEFVHDRVASIYTYTTENGVEKRQGGGTLGDSDGSGSAGSRIAISPFASWTISVPTAFNKDRDLSKVSEIRIAFAGTFRPRTDPGGAKLLSARRARETAARAAS